MVTSGESEDVVANRFFPNKDETKDEARQCSMNDELETLIKGVVTGST